MTTRAVSLAILTTLSLFTAACGDDTPTGLTASLRINSPDEGATVNIAAPPQSQSVPVDFETNWTLKAKGQCGSTDNCGHIYAYVDSSECNASGLPYNAVAVSSPVEVDFGECATATGQHTIMIELRTDSDDIVEGLLGENMVATVKVLAQ